MLPPKNKTSSYVDSYRGTQPYRNSTVRNRPRSAPPRTPSSVASYPHNYTTNVPAAQDFQECVNEAVKNYMDNVISQQGTPRPATMFGGPNITTPMMAQPTLQQIAGPALVPGMPVFAAVVPTYMAPPAMAKPDVNEFIYTGLDVLKKSLPKDRIKSGVSKASRPQTAHSRPITMESMLMTPVPPPIAVPKPPSAPPCPKKAGLSQRVPPATHISVVNTLNGNDKSNGTPPSSPMKKQQSVSNKIELNKQFVNRGCSPLRVVKPETAPPQKNLQNGGQNTKNDEVKKEGSVYDWHWSVWKENEEKRAKAHKRPKTAGALTHRIPTPAATPVIYDFSNQMASRPTSSIRSASPMHFVSKEPTVNSSPYGQALQSWANDATDHEKSVVYNMMKTINKSSGFSASRLERARSSLQGSRPASPVRMTRYTAAKDAPKPAGVQTSMPCAPYEAAKPAGVQTSMPIFGPPDMVKFVPTNENMIVNNYYQRLLENARNGVTNVSPYFTRREVRPMARHKSQPALQKEYTHSGGFFNNSKLPYRTNFTIHPDWVSERKTLAIVNRRH